MHERLMSSVSAPVAQSTKQKALRTLDGMDEIVLNEMVHTGIYVSHVVREDLRAKGTVCGGRQACAIGSAFLGYGVKTDEDGDLPGAGEFERDEFVNRRPGLKLALCALNTEAQALIDAGHRPNRMYDEPIEALFEGSYGFQPRSGPQLTDRKLRNLIKRARAHIEAAPAK